MMTGPCDATGCTNQAEVHYGLEEFYCRPCDEANHLKQNVDALVKAARELTALHYAAFRTDDGSGDGITIIDSDAEYREQFPKWADMAAALKPWEAGNGSPD